MTMDESKAKPKRAASLPTTIAVSLLFLVLAACCGGYGWDRITHPATSAECGGVGMDSDDVCTTIRFDGSDPTDATTQERIDQETWERKLFGWIAVVGAGLALAAAIGTWLVYREDRRKDLAAGSQANPTPP
jgi:hypothetical protein